MVNFAFLTSYFYLLTHEVMYVLFTFRYEKDIGIGFIK